MRHNLQTHINQALILIGLFNVYVVEATHNRAGEITYIQISELSIEATITTWTKTSSADVDRDSLELFWGDGTVEWVRRTSEQILDNDIKKNEYTARHNYPGRGQFVLSVKDPNRIGGILNVNFPISLNVAFYIQTTLTLINPVLQGFNSSPMILQPPIDFACLGSTFIHNPNALDPDGDSLSYELIVPLQDSGLVVPNYAFPDAIAAGGNNQIDMNTSTGTFTWNSPQRAGEYNIAIAIHEWRQGVLINTTIRDMQIFVRECDNEPPTVELPADMCVVAGELVQFDVIAKDPDDGQQVKLSAIGGPFIVASSAAEFDVPMGFSDPPVTGTFSWQTTCEHIADQNYTIVFRAVDNFLDTTGLATLQVWRIKVIGPSPENFRADRGSGSIITSWDSPYDCDQVSENFFQGFTLYRKINSAVIPLDTCNPGLMNTSYQPLAYNITNQLNQRYSYTDVNVEQGLSYCYRVVAEFGRISPAGFAYNLVESLHSDESCQMLSRNQPLIINADVLTTISNSGQIFIRWLKPDVIDLDTTKHKGPYMFRLMRAEGIKGSTFLPVANGEITFDKFDNSVDTTFTDRNLATDTQGYNYRIDFFINGDFNNAFNSSSTASSIFAEAQGVDRAINLSWDEIVPWDNFSYTIFRDNGGMQDSIGTSQNGLFKDTDLFNNQVYCYVIQASGTYGISGLPEPLFNFSQMVCALPIDTMPPCTLQLEVQNICDESPLDIAPDELINILSWNHPNLSCDETDDAVSYNIYYSPVQGADFNLIEVITNINQLRTQHMPATNVSGCYAVTATDRLGNESSFSNLVCVDNCPDYLLPNTFTPNGDGANDYFGPLRNRFIDHVDMKIFNRWGGVVFETDRPDFKWIGQDLKGNDVDDGTYFYTCKIFEHRVSGIIEQEDILQGYIHVIR